MSRLKTETEKWDTETILLFGALGIGLGVTAVVTIGASLWAKATGQVISKNPFDIISGLFTGEIDTTTGIWWWIGGATLALILLLGAVAVMVSRVMPKKKRGDDATAHTAKSGDLKMLGAIALQEKNQRLGVQTGNIFGLPIGKTLPGMWLYSSFEDVAIMIAGPRTGKTTRWVVPRINAAPGAVVNTSNKRDVVDITRQSREETTGEKTWVFDPQGIAGEQQTWWWNPLSYVTNAVQAQAMVQVFVDSTRKRNSTSNAFFDDAARDLIAAMMLAAAKGGLPITILHQWLNDQTNDDAVLILRASNESMVAQTLEGTMNLVAETRSGVYGGAAQIMNFLLNDQAMKWVTPTPGLEEFIPENFVTTKQTLYCLSQEGRGSAAPIVTALTVAVVEAAIEYATTQRGGRLSVPMLIELDEAANVCRWRELPDQYSHFGSRGIIVDTILQSWSQGASAWGDNGMKKLWSAANAKIYGGGVSEKEFLATVSDLIGPKYVDSIQISTGRGRSVSTSKNSQQRPIATVADLQGLPAGRAWLFASGAPAALISLIPYWETNKPTKTRSK